MKTEYKYIKFVQIPQKTKTSIWNCNNKSGNYALGIVKWYPAWRQYCFFPCGNMVFNKGCLEDINYFITQLMDERKK